VAVDKSACHYRLNIQQEGKYPRFCKGKKSSKLKHLPHFSGLMSPNYIDLMTLARPKKSKQMEGIKSRYHETG
jgi:hypothetical protein